MSDEDGLMTDDALNSTNADLNGADEVAHSDPDSASAPGEAGSHEPAFDGTDPEIRRQLMDELVRLIERIEAMTPGYVPPPFSPRRLLKLLDENAGRFSPRKRLGILRRLRSAINEDYLDLDTWKGMWYLVSYSLEYQGDILKRRLTGEYETDEWGMDWEVLEVVRPFLDFLFNTYWRVETSGIEATPEDGPVLLVANHAGRSPWEGAMLSAAFLNQHPAERLTRSLYPARFAPLPFISTALNKIGHAVGVEENARRLLTQAELVAVYPDGYAPSRHNAPPFGWAEVIQLALETGATIVPTAITGAEQTYTALGEASLTTRLTGRPHPLLSPQSPWFGMLSMFPPPTKWFIDLVEPISTADREAGEETVADLVEFVQVSLADQLQLRRRADRSSG